jgi:hypothetical protein
MHCLYCNKRLWLFFLKERLFCSKRHEVAYHDGLSAMNRLMEFTVPVERSALPLPQDRKLSEIYLEPKIHWALSVAVPPLCNFAVDQDRPKPIPPDSATALLLEAVPLAGPVQFPSSGSGVIAFILDSATEPAQKIASIANETIVACRVRSRHGRRVPPRCPAAFSSRTHRRRLRRCESALPMSQSDVASK